MHFHVRNRRPIRWLPVGLFLLSLMLLSGCVKPETGPDATTTPAAIETAQATGNSGESTAGTATIEDYFPVNTGAYYEYSGNNANYATQKYYISYVSDDGSRFQRHISVGQSGTTEVLEKKNGTLKVIYAQRFFCPENALRETPNADIIALQEPLKKGQTWKQDESTSCEITDMNKQVTTPYGTFDTMEVSSTYESGMSQKDYYAKGVGLVQTIYSKEGADDIIVSLNRVEDNAADTVAVALFSPSSKSGKLELMPGNTVTLEANGNAPDALLPLLKSKPGAEYLPLLSDNVKILSFDPGRNNNLMTLNLSKEFYDYIGGLGPAEEKLVLQGLADTFGNFYWVGNFTLQVEGKYYESGHMALSDSEYLTVEVPGDNFNNGEGGDSSSQK